MKNDLVPYKLINGDCTNKNLLDENSIDLTITSPPYNLGLGYSGNEKDDALEYCDYMDFNRRWMANVHYWSKNTGRFCLNVGLDVSKYGKKPTGADFTKAAMDVGWQYNSTIIWNEGNISKGTAWGSWKSASAPNVIAPVELIIVFYKNEWKKDHKGESDITGDEFKNWVRGNWDFNGESAKRIGHEAPFPRELPKRCIKLFSYVGATVLDPFMGSGSTMVETINNKRISIGIEKEEKYCELIRTRVAKETNYMEENSPLFHTE